MDLTNYDGPTVAVLVRKTLSGDRVDSAHLDEDTAMAHLGREIIANRAQPGVGWEVATVPASPTIVRTLDGALGAQPDVEPSGAAELIARQCKADLAAALGLDQPGDWGDMCRQARDARHREEDDYAERVKMSNVLGMHLDPARDLIPSWRALRAEARRQRDLGGERFVAALRDALRDVAPAVADFTRPELLSAVRQLAKRAALVDRLIGDDPARIQLDHEGLDRAARAHWGSTVARDWDSADGDAQQRTVLTVERIIRAYLDEAADDRDEG